MKIAVWDIETTHLKAAFGKVLCVGVKELGQEEKIIVNRASGPDDLVVVKKGLELLEEYDILISYNGIRFDLKYMQQKALYHQLPPLSPKFHIDVYTVARRVMTGSKKLAIVGQYLGFPDKTPLDPEIWLIAAHHPRSDAMREVVYHNKMDLEVLESVYEKLKPFIKTIGNKRVA